ERFRGAIVLVRSLGPARAPAGFADRVVAAAGRAEPRLARRRLLDRLIFPLPVKLPLEAAAILMVGIGVTYVFTHTPELQQASRVETRPAMERAVAVDATTPIRPGLAKTPATEPAASRDRAETK